MDPGQLLPILEEAWAMTTEGRPGPVLVNIPKDILALDFESAPSTKPYIPHRPKPLTANDRTGQIIDALERAERPLLLIGGGVISSPGAPDALARFLDLTDIPVTTTLMGKGAVRAGHPNYLDHVGMHGTVQSNRALGTCDTLLAVGTRFSDRVVANPLRFAEGRTIIHVDIDPAEIGKNVPPAIEVEDDAANFFRAINADLERRTSFEPGWKEWKAHLDDLTTRYNRLIEPLLEPTTPLQPQYVIRRASERCRGLDPICVTDVGQHQMFAAQYFDVESPRAFLSSGGLGTMGFGLPAAIGAAHAAESKRPTLAVVGDGGIQMTIQEFGMLAAMDLHVIVMIIDNQTLGMVRQWQELFYNEHYSESMLANNPDFVAIGKAYGIPGRRVETPEEYELALDEALAGPHPYVMHILVPTMDNVYPMIPAGSNPEDLIMPGFDD